MHMHWFLRRPIYCKIQHTRYPDALEASTTTNSARFVSLLRRPNSIVHQLFYYNYYSSVLYCMGLVPFFTAGWQLYLHGPEVKPKSKLHPITTPHVFLVQKVPIYLCRSA